MDTRRPRKIIWNLTQDAFDNLLAWLDPDRERAGIKYENIRNKLIKIFAWHGCHSPEELADETIDRVSKKVKEIAEFYIGDPTLYFCGVARNVFLESVRKKKVTPAIPPPAEDLTGDAEKRFECLDKCMQQLPAQHREMALQYYQAEKRVKIEQRKVLAEKLGITTNALNIRMHRIRENLKKCVDTCLGREGAG